jgi:pyruvate/2-oxoglutarate dehydrogenase complex dihydrolipoamide dehydrogenase (E3) component
MTTRKWTPADKDQTQEARAKLDVWPLDDYNAILLNEVHPLDYVNSDPPYDEYDLVVIGAGAGGLVSSKQAGRRGAKSAMISESLAGGDCLSASCVPSKALIRSACATREVCRAAEFGICISDPDRVTVDFGAVMRRLRQLRAKIAPADGHGGTTGAGAHVFQGRGRFTGPNTVQVNGFNLKFRKAVVATGGRNDTPSVPGLVEAPFTTNEILFNLETLPPRMVILGSGIVALEMAQCFASFGSKVTVIQRKERLFQSKGGDKEAAELLQTVLEHEGITFLSSVTTKQVTTLRPRGEGPEDLPLMKVTVGGREGNDIDLECECLLVATGRIANVEDLGLEEAGVDYELGKGVVVNDLAQSVSNENVYAVGDCVAGVPRLTHMSGEMAKVVVQNALFDDSWKLSSLVVPAVMYTEPEYATVGISSQEMADKAGMQVDVYRGGLEHNDRAILEGDNVGFVKVVCKAGTDEIVGATIVASRAGEIINEVTLAMKHGIGLDGIGRNIHSYPTTGESLMGCGLQSINAKWKRLDN